MIPRGCVCPECLALNVSDRLADERAGEHDWNPVSVEEPTA